MNKITGALLIIASAILFHGRILLEGVRMGYSERDGLIAFCNFAAGASCIVGVLFLTFGWIRWLFHPMNDSRPHTTSQAKNGMVAGGQDRQT